MVDSGGQAGDEAPAANDAAAHVIVEITSEMVAAVALVLERRFDCSQGIAAIVAEDLLRVALCRKSEGQRSAAADLRGQEFICCLI